MTWLTDLYCLIPRPWLFQSRGFAWLTVMHREVCLKHRNNRREMIPAGALSLWLRAAVFVLFCQRAARATSARAAHYAVIVQKPFDALRLLTACRPLCILAGSS
jgi:hypothetical protein